MQVKSKIKHHEFVQVCIACILCVPMCKTGYHPYQHLTWFSALVSIILSTFQTLTLPGPLVTDWCNGTYIANVSNPYGYNTLRMHTKISALKMTTCFACQLFETANHHEFAEFFCSMLSVVRNLCLLSSYW